MTHNLLAWYCDNYRKLPWRMDPHQPAQNGSFGDPYAIWVSEVMLQQTRVETVIPYYERFMDVFPTAESLADADDQTLYNVWEGLGYYNHARNLRKAAQQLDGKPFPRTLEHALQLSGVGPYIAGAVLSIAYGVRVPAVDGNVMRVLARWMADDRDVALPATMKAFHAMALDVMPVHAGIPNLPGTWNQAMMELGARICVPQTLKCGDCPVSQSCEAFMQDRQFALPVKSAKTPPVEEAHTVVVAYDGESVLLHKPSQGLLRGMWRFPFEEEISDWCPQAGREALPDAVHTFTHRRWRMTGILLRAQPCPPPQGCVWVRLDKLQEYPIPVAMRVYKQWVDEHLI